MYYLFATACFLTGFASVPLLLWLGFANPYSDNPHRAWWLLLAGVGIGAALTLFYLAWSAEIWPYD